MTLTGQRVRASFSVHAFCYSPNIAAPTPKQKYSSRKCLLHTRVVADGCLPVLSFAIQATRSFLAGGYE